VQELGAAALFCPVLRELSLIAAVNPHDDLVVPGQVTRLSALLRDNSDVHVLLGLCSRTRLQSLYAACAGSVTVEGIEGLTSLRQLTSLTLEGGGVPALVDLFPVAHRNWYKCFFGRGPWHFVNKVSCASS
jgi:hypothetical protein